MKPANIVNQGPDRMDEAAQGKFRHRRKAFTAPAGMERLGASLYAIESGASAFPRHYHCANEEAIFVLKGEGLLALGESETHVRAGDFIALPRRAEYAQRLSNSSQLPLR
jgi:uncharacterized cupin superfamily protein